MSNSFRVKLTPLTIDDASLAAQADTATFSAHYARLLQLRDDVATDVTTDEPHPLQSFALANRSLAQYRVERGRSPLGQLLIAAREIRNHIDRAVVVSAGPANRAAQMLFAACCHPYHNELSRGERGSKPRMYFDGQRSDVDHTQGLLDLLTHKPSANIAEQWALIVADAGQLASTATAREVYLSALQASLPTPAALGQRLLLVGREGDSWQQFAPALRIDPMFGLPPQSAEALAVFTPQALLPASVVGLDIVKLLEGAALMHDHYQITSGKDNLVFRLAAWIGAHSQPASGLANLQIMASCRATAAVAEWLHREQELLCPPADADENCAGRRLPVRLTLDQIRRDRLELPADFVAGATGPPAEAPALEIRLARLDEGSLGQFCQLVMLARSLAGLAQGSPDCQTHGDAARPRTPLVA